jgi:hypothetical protein
MLLIADLVSKSAPYVLLLIVQKKDPVLEPFVHYTLFPFVSPLSFRHHDHSLGDDPLPSHLEWVLV